MNAHTSLLRPEGTLFQRLRQQFARAQPLPADSAAEEAASVRALADSYQRSDPSFASDLYAAADRHERAAEATTGR